MDVDGEEEAGLEDPPFALDSDDEAAKMDADNWRQTYQEHLQNEDLPLDMLDEW